jgi:hypothetical protein
MGENGTNNNAGIENHTGAEAVLFGGVFIGRGGEYARGIYTHNSTTLETESSTALGEDGNSDNMGIYIVDMVTVTVRNGSFTGRGGTNALGITAWNSTLLKTESVTALGENGNYTNHGVNISNTVTATLRGGSFTGYGGQLAWGLFSSSNSEVLVDNVTAMADKANSNCGMRQKGGTAIIDSSQFTGSNYGLNQNGGLVYLGVSKLDGGANLTGGGALNCFQVYDESYTLYSCP